MNGITTQVHGHMHSVKRNSHLDPGAFDVLRESQDLGAYPTWLAEHGGDPRAELVHELEALRGGAWGRAERRAFFREILTYWSQANDEMQVTALRLDGAAVHSVDVLAEGKYESAPLANRLADRVQAYDRDVILPLAVQVEKELKKREESLLFIGRDFTPVYLVLHARGKIDRERLHLANVSRSVKDRALEGNMKGLRRLLERAGLERKKLAKRGLVCLDSSMKGKVPAAIFRALALGMDEKDAAKLLTRSHVLYVKSARTTGARIAEAAEERISDGRIAKEDVKSVTNEIERIDELKLTLPTEVKSYKDRRHKVFEWRPKALMMATDVTQEGRLVSARPETPSERINSLLGVLADQHLLRLAQEK